MGEDDDLAPPLMHYGGWEPFFAWKPVILNNSKRVWLRKVYRRELSSIRWANQSPKLFYEYTDIFGVLSSDPPKEIDNSAA